jgi:hypothetical protein
MKRTFVKLECMRIDAGGHDECPTELCCAITLSKYHLHGSVVGLVVLQGEEKASGCLVCAD